MELLICIAIIGVLTAILVPALGRARRSANSIACMNNLRQIGIAMQTYAAEFDGIVPWEGYAEGDRPERHLGKWDEPSTWFNAICKYTRQPSYSEQQAMDVAGGTKLPASGDRSLFICPEAGPAVAGPKDDLIVDGYFMLWGLEPDGTPSRRKTYWCYGYNTQLDAGIEDRHVNYRVCISLARMKNISHTVLMIEKLMAPKEFTPPFTSSIGQQEVSYREFSARHDMGGYLLFLDSHVGYFKRREVLSAPRAPYNYNQPGKVIWNPAG